MKFKLCPNTCIYFIDSIVYIFYTSAGPSMRLITLLNVPMYWYLGILTLGLVFYAFFFEISIVQVFKI